MQRFEYRSARFPADLPVLFILKDASVSGRCKEISSDGMKVEFLEPVAPNCCGTLRIGNNHSSLEVRARVARIGKESECYGVKFLFASDTERKALERLVAIMASPIRQLGPALVP